VACLRAAWVEWAAWAGWTTKPTDYSITQTINHSRVSQEARLFCWAGRETVEEYSVIRHKANKLKILPHRPTIEFR
jgi:hypothetical protein